jgi:hypothetical protein
LSCMPLKTQGPIGPRVVGERVKHLYFQLIIIICKKRTRNVVLAGDGSLS